MSNALFDVIHSQYGNSETFVSALKSRMRLHGISQGKLAKRSGYHPTHLSRWMNGHVKPSLETMVTLDEAMGQLVGGS